MAFEDEKLGCSLASASLHLCPALLSELQVCPKGFKLFCYI